MPPKSLKNRSSTLPFAAIYISVKDLRIAGSLLDKYETRNIIPFLYNAWFNLGALSAKETDVLRKFQRTTWSHLLHLAMQ